MVEGGRRGSVAGRRFDAFVATLIIASVVCTALASEPSAKSYRATFFVLEIVFAVTFFVEYVLRLAVAPYDDYRMRGDPLRARLAWIVSPMALIDLAAIAPALVLLTTNDTGDSGIVLILRVLRLFKLFRYFHAFETLLVVIKSERKPLAAAFSLMAILLVLISTAMHIAERGVQPERFGTISESMWWGIVTFTTVGYGDAVPVTGFGRMIGGLAVICGMGMFALPAGILANGFAEELRRRSFVVTWDLIAELPLFASFSARRIASIARLVRPIVASPGETIAAEGDLGEGVYFLIDGSVEFEFADRSVVLAVGAVFGGRFLAEADRRRASVSAVTRTRLLYLHADAIEELTLHEPELESRLAALSAHFEPAAASQPDVMLARVDPPRGANADAEARDRPASTP